MTTLAFSRGWSTSAVATNPILFAAIVLARRIRRRMKVRADRRVLQAMPDYLLSDIGISRSEIEAATRCGRDFRLGSNGRI